MQITRIFSLKDPNVEVVYISPYELSSEIVNYYYKILELGDIIDFHNRLHFISPEKANDFPSHYSTSRLLLYSPKALKRIRSLIKGKSAYIVPGYPSNDDIKLAKSIDVPLMSGDPQQHMICSSKSGSKRVFNSCEIPTAPGAFEIYEEKEFINTLAILILNNIRIDTWLFKIDDETNSRGIAYFNVDSIAFLKHLRKQTIQIEIGQELLYQLQQILIEKLPSKVKMAIPSLYQYGYREYMNQFIMKGGIIEACPTCASNQISSPSIFFHIDPLGEIKVIGSYDRINGSLYRIIGCSGPQQSLPNMNLEMISGTIGKALYSRNISGYVTVDLVSFPDPSNRNSHPLFWAIGLDCFLNNYSSACFYFYFLVKGHSDAITGECILESQMQSSQQQANSIFSIPSQQHFTHQSIDKSIQRNGYNKENSILNQKNNQSSLIAGKQSNSQILPNFINETRSFVYFPYVQHPGLQQLQYKTFFHLCRIESVSFDLEKRIGSAFILLDSLQSSLVGIMTVGKNIMQLIYQITFSFAQTQKYCGILLI